ncbi:Putative amidohydrolase YtcJ [Leucoagaricus sp. SymC.cos]|nr:Putative amidohydrolase YtcJ [Leucoagaricus sp. SymC.cos]
MDSTKPPRNVPPAMRPWLPLSKAFLLTFGAAALAVHSFWPSFSEYTLCSRNGQIYTVNDAQPLTQCITVQDSRISRVGSYEDVALISIRVPFLGRAFKIRRPTVLFVDVPHIIVPGLADAHAHVLENGWMMQLPLAGSASVQGIFVDNAMDLIPLPSWSHQQMEEYFSTTVNTALQYGLTSIHDADTKMPMVTFYKRKAEEGKIPLRLYLMGGVHLPSNGSEVDIATYISDEWEHGIPRFVNYGKQGRLTLRSVKLFADGALGSWGAALLAPYSDNPGVQGLLLQPPEVLRAAVRRYWRDDMQVNIHCIGDKANRLALDIFEELIKEKAVNVSEWRPRIEHAQIIDMHDLERVGKLGVTASIQPTHATSDMWYAEKRLGPKRMKGAYAYATLLRTSGHGALPLGSDFPVEGVNPLLGFYAVVKRLAVDGTSPHGPSGWQVGMDKTYPNECLTRKQALKGMTLDAAYASFQEHEIGSLEVGKKADFVVFDRDFVGCLDEEVCDGSEILEAKVKAVVIDGKVAWGALPGLDAREVMSEVFEKAKASVRGLALF